MPTYLLTHEATVYEYYYVIADSEEEAMKTGLEDAEFLRSEHVWSDAISAEKVEE